LAHEDAFMPWKETRTVDQRLQFLSSYQKEEMSVTDLCHEYGISRPTAYKWIKRYDEVGPEGLLHLARTQHSSRHNRRSSTASAWCLTTSVHMKPSGTRRREASTCPALGCFQAV